MRLALIGLLACGGNPPDPVGEPPASAPMPAATAGASNSEMVEIQGGVVRLGRGDAQAVPGFVPPPPPVGEEPVPGLEGAVPPRTQGLAPRLFAVDTFSLDRTEVTREAYARFLVATGHPPPRVDEPWAEDGWNWVEGSPPPGTEQHPVVLVNWYDARAYCRSADKRLPTEAEWQLAALGPSEAESRFPWGNDYRPNAFNHGTVAPPFFDDSDGFHTTAPVGSFPAGASRDGVLDLFGNAWEWTADLRVDTWDLVIADAGNPPRNPRTGLLGLNVAVRGGSYYHDLRPNPAGERHAFLPEIRRKTSGFRCAR